MSDSIEEIRALTQDAEKEIRAILIKLEKETGLSLWSLSIIDEQITITGSDLVRRLEIDIKMTL